MNQSDLEYLLFLLNFVLSFVHALLYYKYCSDFAKEAKRRILKFKNHEKDFFRTQSLVILMVFTSLMYTTFSTYYDENFDMQIKLTMIITVFFFVFYLVFHNLKKKLILEHPNIL